jgi:hypothetical protein
MLVAFHRMCFHEAMQGPDSEVLQSWKDVSRYLNSDIRTLQRWERTRGLPIRRMPGGTKPRVYAIKSELDRWRRSGGSTSRPKRSLAIPHPRRPLRSCRFSASTPTGKISTSPMDSPMTRSRRSHDCPCSG